MPKLTDLPDDVLTKISSHLTDPIGLLSASKALHAGAQAEIDRRMIESFVYFRALRVVCLSPRILLWHTQSSRTNRVPECRRDHMYLCCICKNTVTELGGCESCKVMVRTYPWMRTWYRALPLYIVRMFHYM